MPPLKRPAGIMLTVAAGAVVLGGAGSLLGPGWAVGGMVAGPVVALAAASVVQVFTTPDPSDLLRADRHREALAMIEVDMPAWRRMSHLWPGQFRDALAHVLMNKSMVQLAAHRDGEALAAAEQAVAIYRSLAAGRSGKPAADLAAALNNLSYPLRVSGRREEAAQAAAEAVRMYRALAAARPGRYHLRLAGSLGTHAEVLAQAGQHDQALAATSEAAGIYQDANLGTADPGGSDAAEVLFLHGQLLCRLGTGKPPAHSPAHVTLCPGPPAIRREHR